MTKKLFYVPVLLVIRAPGADSAKMRADDLMDAILRAEPCGFDGYSMEFDVGTSPASKHWADVDQAIEVDFSNGVAHAKIIEVAS